MKKGFTLIELIITLSLCLFVASFTVVLFSTFNKQLKEKQYNRIVDEIEAAADIYLQNESSYKNELYNGSRKFTLIPLRILMDEGLVKEKLINPKTNKLFDVESCVKAYLNKDDTLFFKYPGYRDPEIIIEKKDYSIGCKVNFSDIDLLEGVTAYDQLGKKINNPNFIIGVFDNSKMGLKEIKISHDFIVDGEKITKSVFKTINVGESSLSNKDITEIIFDDIAIDELTEDKIFSDIKGKTKSGDLIDLSKDDFQKIDLNEIKNGENTLEYIYTNNCDNVVIKKTRKITFKDLEYPEIIVTFRNPSRYSTFYSNPYTFPGANNPALHTQYSKINLKVNFKNSAIKREYSLDGGSTWNIFNDEEISTYISNTSIPSFKAKATYVDKVRVTEYKLDSGYIYSSDCSQTARTTPTSLTFSGTGLCLSLGKPIGISEPINLISGSYKTENIVLRDKYEYRESGTCSCSTNQCSSSSWSYIPYSMLKSVYLGGQFKSVTLNKVSSYFGSPCGSWSGIRFCYGSGTTYSASRNCVVNYEGSYSVYSATCSWKKFILCISDTRVFVINHYDS